jgi:hypothetical protein
VSGAEENVFFRNGISAGHPYFIFRYLSDGTPSPPHAVIGPENNGNVQHVA